MRILIVASNNRHKSFAPFIVEQANAVKRMGHDVDYFGIVGKGVFGYINNRRQLIQKISEFKPDIIHAHYGLSGLLANLQRKVPVVTTYHGSDINDSKALWLSKLSILLSKHNIFVSQKTVDIAGVKKKYSLIPCGIDIHNFANETKALARENLGWDKDSKIVLFAGAFENKVKNYPLAQKAVDLLENIEIRELKGYSRKQMSDAFYAANVLLMTSFTEGSPQVVKEAMYCGCPIVSVDVGDVANLLGEIDGCYITNRNPENIADALKAAILFDGRTNGRERITKLGLTNEQIAKKIVNIYKSVSDKQ